MAARIRIRGIYSTALTKLVLDWGYTVSQPSAVTSERFGIEENDEPFDILLHDREDLQGIELAGAPERICQFLTFLQERLLDPVLVEFSPEDDERPHAEARVEFPGSAKQTLDEIRQSVTPTLKRHHQMQTIDSSVLEMAEVRLSAYPEERESIEKTVFLEAILLPLEKCGTVRMEHLRPSGKAMRPRQGALVSAEGGRIVFRRPFANGRYDGLDIDIHPGDYGLTEIQEGQWFVKHSYFRKDGKLIGEYFNINSPVELYPYGARYMDLEVDVIRRAGEAPFIVDEEKLSLLTQQGCIGFNLERKAMNVAEELVKELREGNTPR